MPFHDDDRDADAEGPLASCEPCERADQPGASCSDRPGREGVVSDASGCCAAANEEQREAERSREAGDEITATSHEYLRGWPCRPLPDECGRRLRLPSRESPAREFALAGDVFSSSARPRCQPASDSARAMRGASSCGAAARAEAAIAL